jgi:hypothetical protein
MNPQAVRRKSPKAELPEKSALKPEARPKAS